MEPTRAWWFDESAGNRWLDAAAAADFDARLSPSAASEREALASAGVAPGSTLIDIGAGTGALAVEAARICGRVIAIDPSTAMLDVLRAKVARAGLSNITCVSRGILTYDHEGPPVDVAMTRHTLHHLPDFWKVEALRRIVALLRPGGRFLARELVYSFDPADMPEAVERWISGVTSAPGGAERAFFEDHVREKYSTYGWLFEAMLRHAGFEIEAASYAPSGAYARYLCRRPS